MNKSIADRDHEDVRAKAQLWDTDKYNNKTPEQRNDTRWMGEYHPYLLRLSHDEDVVVLGRDPLADLLVQGLVAGLHVHEEAGVVQPLLPEGD